MPYTPILATLGYVFSPDRKNVLLVHRNARPHDNHIGKYNGLGGKLNPSENIVTGMKREIREEAGIECEQLQLAGTISWPGFGPKGEDWFGFLFRILEWSGTVRNSNEEGTLHWVPCDEVLSLPLWSGDRFFLPDLFNLEAPSFHGVMPYRDGEPLSWSVVTIPHALSFRAK